MTFTDDLSTSVQELESDHRTIETALRVLRHEADKGRATGTVQASLVKEMCSFSQSFVDRCHHGKEEGCFFPCLERRGMPGDSGPIAVMLAEHEQGRRLVARISESLDRHAAGLTTVLSVIEPCEEYCDLLAQHIAKEEGILFPMGSRMMDGSDDLETTQCFDSKKDQV